MELVNLSSNNFLKNSSPEVKLMVQPLIERLYHETREKYMCEGFKDECDCGEQLIGAIHKDLDLKICNNGLCANVDHYEGFHCKNCHKKVSVTKTNDRL